jgi:hypothetical protein
MASLDYNNLSRRPVTRRRALRFRTAMPKAFASPTITTSCFPRDIGVDQVPFQFRFLSSRV